MLIQAYMIIVSPFIVPKNFRSICLFPLIFLRRRSDGEDAALLNHERIHLRQQAELLVLPFFIWYGIDFLYLWVVLKDRRLAYYNIGFEREAYRYERNFDYLKTRKIWSFLQSELKI